MKHSIKNVRALSFDLDDTLYDNKPVINNALLELYNYLASQYPKFASNYDYDKFINTPLLLKTDQELITDFSKRRRLHIKQVINACGYKKLTAAAIEKAFSVFWRARQRVTLFPDTHQILLALSTNFPLVSISNGNACTKSIGIGQYFQYSISAADTGKPKPDKSMFLLACKKLQIQAEQLIHIGDSIHYDIEGAYQAGCRSIWLNQHREVVLNHQAEVVIKQLSELLDFDLSR